MSDDLISRKALKQAIDHDFYEHYTKYHDTDQRALIDMVMDDIDEMPTAFNKKKVIEELREMQSHSKLCKNQCGFTSTEYFDYMGAEVAYGTAIEIVEKGGTE